MLNEINLSYHDLSQFLNKNKLNVEINILKLIIWVIKPEYKRLNNLSDPGLNIVKKLRPKYI